MVIPNVARCNICCAEALEHVSPNPPHDPVAAHRQRSVEVHALYEANAGQYLPVPDVEILHEAMKDHRLFACSHEDGPGRDGHVAV